VITNQEVEPVSFKRARIVNQICVKRNDESRTTIYDTRTIEDALEFTYSAIILPSYSGKSQLPYSFRVALTLYFVFGDSEEGFTQPIYSNFKSISKYLKKLAIMDLKEFLSVEDTSPYIYTTLLAAEKRNIPSYVLGFIYKIMEMDINFEFPGNEEDGDENSENPSWMRHHAKRPSFTFEKLSVSEFKAKIREDERFKNYFVFLDEFKAHDWSVFIRNIIRAVGMWCTVAATHTTVENLTGINTTRSNGNMKYPPVWCLLQLQLAPTAPSFLSKCNQIKQVLLNRCREAGFNAEEYKSLENVLDYFADQMTSARPGLAKEALEQLSFLMESNDPIKAEKVFCTVISGVSKMITIEKSAIKTVSGYITNLFVHIDRPYIEPHTGRDDNISILARRVESIHEHLFSLRHGIHSSISRPSSADIDLRLMPIYSARDQGSMSLSNLCFGATQSTWQPAAYLAKTESILTLACMSIKPVYTVISLARKDICTNYTAIVNSQNPQADSLNGNQLEVISSLATIVSSHTSPVGDDPFKVTYEGVLGHHFIENFTRNLIFDPSKGNNLANDTSLTRQYRFNFSRIFMEFSERIRIPFLYAANMEIPTQLKEAFPLRNSSIPIRLGSFERTCDKDQIDGVFDICVVDSSDQPAVGIIEAKYWASKLDFGDYSSIVDKALKFRSGLVSLHLLVCLKITNFQSPKKISRKYRGCNFYLVKGNLGDKNSTNPVMIKLQSIGIESARPRRVFLIFSFSDLFGSSNS
jgi:hypothetical protein